MAVLTRGSAAEAGMRPERVERARELLDRWVQQGRTPAICALVARRGIIVLHEAFGRLRPEPGSPPLERDSIFPVSSISKPVTATLALQLVEDGLLGLNRPVVDYVPELTDEGWGEVLVHHLLTHSSGFDDFALIPEFLKRIEEQREFPPCPPTQHPIIHELLTIGYPLPLSSPPATQMAYGNTAYLLVGEIVRRVSGRAFWELAAERVFAPLGMSASHFVVPRALSGRVVQRAPQEPLFDIPERYLPEIGSRAAQELPHPAAGLFSTARDLAVFGQTFLDGGAYGDARILSQPSAVAMTRNQIPGLRVRFGPTITKEASYGYGWFIHSVEKWKYFYGTLPSVGSYWHSGGGGAMLFVDPGHELVFVYLSIADQTPTLEPIWDFDLFQNVIASAIAEPAGAVGAERRCE